MWANTGYTGRFVRDARKIWDLAVAIVERPDQAKGFVLLRRRWIVEHSFAWLTEFRRLVRDYETLPTTHEAMIWTAATWQLSKTASPADDHSVNVPTAAAVQGWR